MGKISKKIGTLFRCYILNGHRVEESNPGPLQGNKNGPGDSYDLFGRCEDCGCLRHTDTHMYGDAKWRKEPE